MGFWSRRCSHCRVKLPGDVNYCEKCGEPVEELFVRCVQKDCDGLINIHERSCGKCGAEQPEIRGEVHFDLVWEQPEGELARRYQVDTESRMVDGHVTVREGTEVLILGDGAVLKHLEPGTHPFETTFRDLQLGAEGPRRYEAVYFDTAESPQVFRFDEVPARDGLPCHLALRLVLEVAKPERLLTAVMRTAPVLAFEELRVRIAHEVQNAVEEAAASWPAGEIAGSTRKKTELASQVQSHMRGTLEGLGIRLVRVETLAAEIRDLEEVREIRKKRALRGYRDEEESELAEQNLAWHRRKAKAWAEIRKHLQEAEIEKIEDRADLKDFLRRVNREQKEKDLVHQDELDELVAKVEYRKEDRELARARLLKQLELEQELELEQVRVLGEAANLKRGLQGRIDRERLDWEAKLGEAKDRLELDKLKVQADLSRKRGEMELTQDEKDREAVRKRDDISVRTRAYQDMKRGKAEARKTELEALKGMGADQIAAALAEHQPKLADALTEAFSKRNAEERAELERRHAGEMRQIHEAILHQNNDLVRSLVEKLSDSVGAAVYTRATAGDREADAVRSERRPEAPVTEGTACRKCGTVGRPGVRFCGKCGVATG